MLKTQTKHTNLKRIFVQSIVFGVQSIRLELLRCQPLLVGFQGDAKRSSPQYVVFEKFKPLKFELISLPVITLIYRLNVLPS